MKRRHCTQRSGVIAVFALVLMVSLMAFVAFAVDFGCLLVARTELQRTADAAAVAAAWQLIDEGGWSGSPQTRATADRYAAINMVGIETMELGEGDVDIGYLADVRYGETPLVYTDPSQFNAVQVNVQKSAAINGEVSLFFARVLGQNSIESGGLARAAFLNNVRGFQAPKQPGHLNLQILPFALDEETWLGLEAAMVDNWNWIEQNGGAGEVLAGTDQVYEMNLFPQGTGSPGNRGTVDIGSSNNSTADIARQIVDGISPHDLSHVGGTLELTGVSHTLELNGDTGISAGVKDELASIIGQNRIIPIFRTVVNPGNNAQYTIVNWVGVKIMYVKLTGPMKQKRLMVQPAKVITYGALPASPSDPQLSDFVYSPPWLVR
ncbi:MAG: pilus assembly protein TadG-related protein [Pirellulales bacterium]